MAAAHAARWRRHRPCRRHQVDRPLHRRRCRRPLARRAVEGRRRRRREQREFRPHRAPWPQPAPHAPAGTACQGGGSASDAPALHPSPHVSAPHSAAQPLIPFATLLASAHFKLSLRRFSSASHGRSLRSHHRSSLAITWGYLCFRYVVSFVLHFALLSSTGDGARFMTPPFRATLGGDVVTPASLQALHAAGAAASAQPLGFVGK
eukprot:2855730-Pleurochrysis_carterae.AAC.2